MSRPARWPPTSAKALGRSPGAGSDLTPPDGGAAAAAETPLDAPPSAVHPPRVGRRCRLGDRPAVGRPLVAAAGALDPEWRAEPRAMAPLPPPGAGARFAERCRA